MDADRSFSCGTGMVKVPSNKIKVTIIPKGNPAVLIRSDGITICEGMAASFTATTADAGTYPSFTWKVNGVVTGTNSKQLITNTLKDGDVISCEIRTDPDFTCTNYSKQLQTRSL